MTDWRKAMEAQVDTAEWWTTAAGQKYGQGFLEAFNKTDYPQNPITGDLARHEYLQLQGADTYTVTFRSSGHGWRIEVGSTSSFSPSILRKRMQSCATTTSPTSPHGKEPPGLGTSGPVTPCTS